VDSLGSAKSKVDFHLSTLEAARCQESPDSRQAFDRVNHDKLMGQIAKLLKTSGC
jgi:hypothetical protein